MYIILNRVNARISNLLDNESSVEIIYPMIFCIVPFLLFVIPSPSMDMFLLGPQILDSLPLLSTSVIVLQSIVFSCLWLRSFEGLFEVNPATFDLFVKSACVCFARRTNDNSTNELNTKIKEIRR